MKTFLACCSENASRADRLVLVAKKRQPPSFVCIVNFRVVLSLCLFDVGKPCSATGFHSSFLRRMEVVGDLMLYHFFLV